MDNYDATGEGYFEEDIDPAQKLTEEGYNDLLAAKNVICHFCEADECEKCRLTLLLDQAADEADIEN